MLPSYIATIFVSYRREIRPAARQSGGPRPRRVREKRNPLERDRHRQSAHRRRRRVPGRRGRLGRRLRARRVHADADAAEAALAPAARTVARSLDRRPLCRRGRAAQRPLRAQGAARSDPRLPGRRCAATSASRRRGRRRSPPCTRPWRRRMYRYDEFDAAFVSARVAQFRDQVARRLAGELTEEQFRPHAADERPLPAAARLHAAHRRALRHAERRARCASSPTSRASYDRGYGHFTTRQNIQFNWPTLKDVPDILAELASVEMHAIQTSRQLHPQRHRRPLRRRRRRRDRRPAPLCRNPAPMVVAASRNSRSCRASSRSRSTAPPHDRAVIQAHDIGLQVVRNEQGEMGFARLCRRRARPHADASATRCANSCPSATCSPTSRRSCASTISMAGATTSTRRASRSCCTKRAWRACATPSRPNSPRTIARASRCRPQEIARIERLFRAPAARAEEADERPRRAAARQGRASSRSSSSSTSTPHKTPGYAIVTISLKPIGGAPGDASADQMDAVADLAEDYSHDELRVSPRAEPDPALRRARRPHRGLRSARLGRARHAQRRARSATSSPAPGSTIARWRRRARFPIAQRLSERFGDGARARAIGPLKIKISGCINACGHHHVGHIGILGLERAGEETYQVTLGGSGDESAAIGEIVGPGFSSENIVEAVETVVETYMAQRTGPDEDFLAAFRRLGMAPFKEALYERSAGADI